MCFIKMSAGNGESAANEPEPLISQQSMLMDQGCSQCTKGEAGLSPRDKNLGARVSPAPFPQSLPQLAAPRLAAQLSLCSHSQPGGKILIPNRGPREGNLLPARHCQFPGNSSSLVSASPSLSLFLSVLPIITVSPTLLPKFLASDVHVNLFCSQCFKLHLEMFLFSL